MFESTDFTLGGRAGVPPTGPREAVVSDADVSTWPFVNVGKLIVEGATRAYCTAQFVGSSNVLLTAAHCLHDGQDWIRNPASGKPLLKFYRALRGSTYAQFVPTTCAAVSAHWANGAHGNPLYDYAFIRTAVPSASGWLALRLALPYTSGSAVGYPYDYKNQAVLAVVQGAMGSSAGGKAEMLQNPFLDGASGGAWIGDLNASHAGNYVIGLNSYRNGTSMMGPLFTADMDELYSFVNQSCPP